MKRSQRGVRGLVRVVLFGALFCASSASAQTSVFDGTFVFSGGATQRTAISQAIETATSTLPASDRSQLRAQLDEITRPAARLVMQRAGAEFVMSSGGVELRSPTNGTRVDTAGDWQLEQRLTSDALEQRVENGAFAQVYRYTISPDRRTLTVTVRITVASLSEPIAYALTYRKP